MKNYSNINTKRKVYLHLTTQRAIPKDTEITIRYTPVLEVVFTINNSLQYFIIMINRVG